MLIKVRLDSCFSKGMRPAVLYLRPKTGDYADKTRMQKTA